VEERIKARVTGEALSFLFSHDKGLLAREWQV
jgi:hypothetical protein